MSGRIRQRTSDIRRCVSTLDYPSRQAFPCDKECNNGKSKNNDEHLLTTLRGDKRQREIDELTRYKRWNWGQMSTT